MRKARWEMTPEELDADMRASWPHVNNMYKPGGWQRGDEEIFLGDENGEPYVVQITEPGSICLSVVIFAASEEDAKARIIHGLEQYLHNTREAYDAHMAKEDRSHQWEREYEYKHWDYFRAKAALEIVAKGWIFCMPFDKRLIAKAPWAVNDTLI